MSFINLLRDVQSLTSLLRAIQNAKICLVQSFKIIHIFNSRKARWVTEAYLCAEIWQGLAIVFESCTKKLNLFVRMWPEIDEVRNLYQGYGLILAPTVKVYLALTDGGHWCAYSLQSSFKYSWVKFKGVTKTYHQSLKKRTFKILVEKNCGTIQTGALLYQLEWWHK